MNPEERLIIALDTPTVDTATNAVNSIGEAGRFYKIGYQLMPIGGLDFARKLSEQSKKVFLDFKFHDIGATVERGVKSICKLGGDILTVHAEPDVLKGAVAGRGDDPRLKIFGVTVLTSLDDQSLKQSGYDISLENLVLKRAAFAAENGADGVIASAKEASAIRKEFGDALEIITPGIRPKGAAADDQKRIVTPADAISAGANRLVVGRPIINAASPAQAAADIIDQIAEQS